MPVAILHELVGEGTLPEPLGGFSYDVGETAASFRNKLTNESIVDGPFDFWDKTCKRRMPRRMERINKIEDMEDGVYIIVGPTGLGMGDAAQDPVVLAATRTRNLQTSIEGIESQLPLLNSSNASNNNDCSLDQEDALHGSQATSPPIQEVVLDVMMPESGAEGIEDAQTSKITRLELKSVHIDPSHLKLWLSNVDKLESHMAELGYADHRWIVRTWDDDSHPRGVLQCLECEMSYSGSSGMMEKAQINNCFANFKTKHIKTRKHHKSWCTKRKLNVSDEEINLRVKRSALDDRATLNLHLKIVERVNLDEPCEKKPFIVVGDLERQPLILFYYRVKCVYCGDDMALVPQQRNLEHNLREHLAAPRHQNAMRNDIATKNGGPLLTGRPGRPSNVDKRDVRQKTIHKFFGHDQGRPSGGGGAGTSSGKGEGTIEEEMLQSLLCWGLWRESVLYQGSERLVKDILNDQLRGECWYAEPHVQTNVFCHSSGVLCSIKGLFRHIRCSRLSQLGGGFEDLTCSFCYSIHLQNDFRLRVYREGRAPLKRGSRTTSNGTRLGYLTSHEIQNQSRTMARNISIEKIKVRRLQARLAALQTKLPSLREILSESAKRGDVVRFCRSILHAHKHDLFGGKGALWDLLQDIVLNLNRKSTGRRYRQGTKVLCQALFQHGGRRVVDCLSANLIGPTLNTLQRDRRGLSYFRAGLHDNQFQLIARVFSSIKQQLGIVGDVPCFLAEDETCVKKSVRWVAKTDALLGFCGPNDNHLCSTGFEVIVGDGVEGFDHIVEAFQNNKIGNLARCIMVNPMHEKFPKLCLVACSTCNQFDSNWVRLQWETIIGMWNIYCLPFVGPILGHASDGDPRRRKLMLEDYSGRGSYVKRNSVGWVGWRLTHSVLPDPRPGITGSIPYGLHDQDYIHNGKKLVNPLDSTAKILKLGSQIALLNHLHQVYDLYPVSMHGLNQEDILRTDRQNWASAQRICSRKAQAGLCALRERGDARVELTLGTEIYLQICSNYVDVFLDTRLSLRDRVVLCAKVGFFFRLWRLWIFHGDHSVGGNTQRITQKNMVPMQTFLDIQMSVHFVVLLIVVFRDHYQSLPVPLHLTGSDACEQFFSKVGGMKGHERSYDISELIDCSTSLNRMAELALTDGVASVGKSHKKHRPIWMVLHPLSQDEKVADLRDYTGLETNQLVVECLKEGFGKAQELCTRLEMHPSCSLKDKAWWETPWKVEDQGSKFGGWCETEVECLPTAGDELLDGWQPRAVPDPSLPSSEPSCSNVEPDDLVDDGVSELDLAVGEAHGCFTELFADLEPIPFCISNQELPMISPTVIFEGRPMYKSTLVSQLVGNPVLSKDRLTRVKSALYFNNLVDKPKIRAASQTRMMGKGSDCGVFFVSDVPEVIARTRSKTRSGKGGADKSRSAKGTNVNNKRPHGKAVPVESITGPNAVWWLGRVQQIRMKYHGKVGRVKADVDLLDRPGGTDPNDPACCEVYCNWFTPTRRRHHFEYKTTDPQWIDLDAIITTVSLRVTKEHPDIFILDPGDAKCLDEFVMNARK